MKKKKMDVFVVVVVVSLLISIQFKSASLLIPFRIVLLDRYKMHFRFSVISA